MNKSSLFALPFGRCAATGGGVARAFVFVAAVAPSCLVGACGDSSSAKGNGVDAGNASDAAVAGDATVADAGGGHAADGAASADSSSADAATVDSTAADVAVSGDSPASDAALALVPSWGWTYASGDPNNATPALLAAYADGVVLAGSSQDPKVVGVASFDDASTISEAFLGRLGHDGRLMWSVPLHGSGMPSGIAAESDGTVVVAAPYLTDQPLISVGFVSSDIYLGKFGADGSTVYEKDSFLTDSVNTGDSVSVGGVAVDSSGNVYVVGSIDRANTGDPAVLLAKYDSSGAVQWSKVFPGDTGGGYQTYGAAVGVLANGNIVITGDFDGHIDFGGGPLASRDAGADAFHVLGYVACFTPAGAWVSNAMFGTGPVNTGIALAPTDAGDLLLGGNVEGPVSFSGNEVTGDLTHGAAFLARLDPAGTASWATLVADAGPSLVTSNGPFVSAIALDGIGNAYSTGELGGQTLIASYLAANGAGRPNIVGFVGDGGTGVQGASVAVDSTASLWISGSFGASLTLGAIVFDGAVPENAGFPQSVFIARIDPRAP